MFVNTWNNSLQSDRRGGICGSLASKKPDESAGDSEDRIHTSRICWKLKIHVPKLKLTLSNKFNLSAMLINKFRCLSTISCSYISHWNSKLRESSRKVHPTVQLRVPITYPCLLQFSIVNFTELCFAENKRALVILLSWSFNWKCSHWPVPINTL